jgi:hypothetical protein
MASNQHARTLEVFDDLGVVDEVLAASGREHAVNLYATHEAGRGAVLLGPLSLTWEPFCLTGW